MKIKKSDIVIVISGKDKGKKGAVLEAYPASGKVLVEGVNLAKVHVKPEKRGEPGKVIEVAKPIDASNVMFFDEKAGKGIRLGYATKDGKKVRIAKKSKAAV